MKGKSKPKWIRTKIPTKRRYREIQNLVNKQKLHTVCEEAFCPNCAECWESGTATFLLMGDICTRNCKFCDVTTGNPRGYLDPSEPDNLVQAVKDLKLNYVVLTSVDRDDLEDSGAQYLANCIKKIRQKSPEILIEILIPDFRGSIDSLRKVVVTKPNVIGHNIETTKALTPIIRDKRAGYKQSLQVLKNIKIIDPNYLTKSSIMLGLGETDEQVLTVLKDLRKINVDILTLGQYLQPSRKSVAVVEYVEPQKFVVWERIALKMGFLYVASGPLVRSSYRAGEYYVQNYLRSLKYKE